MALKASLELRRSARVSVFRDSTEQKSTHVKTAAKKKRPNGESAHESTAKRFRANTRPKHDKIREKIVPKVIAEHLDVYVVGQEEAKKTIAVGIYEHMNRIEHNKRIKSSEHVTLHKDNILMIGPTGTGKTLLIDTVTKMLKIPTVIADCPKITANGYKGADVDDIIQNLFERSGHDVEKTESGCIFLDEFDKICATDDGQKDVGGAEVQKASLKLVEGTLVRVTDRTDHSGKTVKEIDINTKDILIVAAGAFVGLEEIVKERLEINGDVVANGDVMKKLQTVDLYTFGFSQEILARFPARCVLEPPSVDTLKRILVEPRNSLVSEHVTRFSNFNCQLEFTNAALAAIAQAAISDETGARGVRAIMSHLLRDAYFEIPGSGVKSVRVDRINGRVKVLPIKN